RPRLQSWGSQLTTLCERFQHLDINDADTGALRQINDPRLRQHGRLLLRGHREPAHCCLRSAVAKGIVRFRNGSAAAVRRLIFVTARGMVAGYGPGIAMQIPLESPMYKHILIATDGSELAGKAVAAGLGLAKSLNAKVTAVNATEPWAAMVT